MKIMVKIILHIWIGYELSPNTGEELVVIFYGMDLSRKQEIEDTNSLAAMFTGMSQLR